MSGLPLRTPLVGSIVNYVCRSPIGMPSKVWECLLFGGQLWTPKEGKEQASEVFSSLCLVFSKKNG